MNTTTSHSPESIDHAAVLAEGLREEIVVLYDDLAREPGGWVMLQRLRERLSASVSRAEVDTALATLFARDEIRLIAEVNQRAMTPADRAAAVSIGGEHKHLYRVPE